MELLWTILIGFVIGLLARAVKPGNDKMGIVLTTLVGIAGAFLAGLIGRSLGWYTPNEPAGFIASVVGAVLLLVIVSAVRASRPMTKPMRMVQRSSMERLLILG
jgi:uncharacterized membrane protein YeaQ/YmgE (transglycosylase-associated protein family)